jgi:hypothetical protein
VEVISSLLASLCCAKAEIDATVLQPIAKKYVAGLPEYQHVLYHATTSPMGFTASPNWIRCQLRDMELHYKKVTNLAGKLPDEREAIRETMLVRLAFLINLHKVPKSLVLNLDEAPMDLSPTTGYTWAKKGKTGKRLKAMVHWTRPSIPIPLSLLSKGS